MARHPAPAAASRRRALRTLVLGTVAGLALGTGLPAAAQAFPSKPIRIVVPFPAGGGTDTIARALGDAMARDLGQPVIVDNKAGAGTVIGNDAVAKSPADGHTLLLTTNALAIVPSLYPKLPYAPATAFASVALLGRAPSVVVVRQDSPIASASAMLAQMRAQPGRLTYGSAGNGTSTHLAAELLKTRAKVFVTHVPYRGASPMVTDVLGGQLDLGFATLPSVAPMIAAGRLRALAVTGPVRSPLLPQVPTLAESGVPGYEAEVWYGVFAPAGTPPSVLQQLHAALARAAKTDAFAQRAASEGLVPTLDGPQATDRVVRADEVLWRQVITAQSIKVE